MLAPASRCICSAHKGINVQKEWLPHTGQSFPATNTCNMSGLGNCCGLSTLAAFLIRWCADVLWHASNNNPSNSGTSDVLYLFSHFLSDQLQNSKTSYSLKLSKWHIIAKITCSILYDESCFLYINVLNTVKRHYNHQLGLSPKS